MRQKGIKIISNNRKASFDYHLDERFEAGIVLTGTEIKSIRNHNADLKRGYARVQSGQVWLYDMHIPPYVQGNRENHEPERPRKLLLHKREIAKLEQATQEQGVTIVPTKLYLKDGWAKIEIAVARGKRKFDKRAAIAKKESERQIERALKRKYDY